MGWKRGSIPLIPPWARYSPSPTRRPHVCFVWSPLLHLHLDNHLRPLQVWWTPSASTLLHRWRGVHLRHPKSGPAGTTPIHHTGTPTVGSLDPIRCARSLVRFRKPLPRILSFSLGIGNLGRGVFLFPNSSFLVLMVRILVYCVTVVKFILRFTR